MPGFPFVHLTLLLCGLLTKAEGVFAPVNRAFFSLSYAQMTLIPASFFAASLFSAPLIGKVIDNKGYPRAFFLGTFCVALGTFGLLGSHLAGNYPFFLVSVVFAGAGIKALIVTGSCFSMESSTKEKQPAALSLVQSFYSFGGFLVPFLFSFLLMDRGEFSVPLVRFFYALAGLSALILLYKSLKKRPEAFPLLEKRMADSGIFPKPTPFLLFGFFTLLCYMGFEVCLDTFLICFLYYPEGYAIPLDEASRFAAIYYAGFSMGRFAGGGALGKASAGYVLPLAALCSLAFLALFLFKSFQGVSLLVLLMGATHSILYPLIVSMTLQHSKQPYPKVAGFINISAIGGALLPFFQGILADRVGLKASFILPLSALPIILIFGLSIAFQHQAAFRRRLQSAHRE